MDARPVDASRIADMVSDARFLTQHGRHFGALTVLLVAVAASSRRAFPKGKTKSLAKPKEQMGDGEAFKLFLGGRLRRLLLGEGYTDRPTSSGITFDVEGKTIDLADAIYRYYRNAIIHEGELAARVEFRDSRGHGLTITSGETFSLDLGLLDTLVDVVSGADCNATLFGRELYELKPLPGSNEAEFVADIVGEYHLVGPGRVETMKRAILFMGDVDVAATDDDDLRRLFDLAFENPESELKGGDMTGLKSRGFADQSGQLTPRGIAFLRRIAAQYTRERVTLQS